MTDLYPHTLASRIQRSVDDARRGMAVLVIIQPSERDEAARLVGGEPVICATADEALMFLDHYMPKWRKR